MDLNAVNVAVSDSKSQQVMIALTRASFACKHLQQLLLGLSVARSRVEITLRVA